MQAGGMVIGYIGDKYGRKSALEISIFLTVSCTVLLGMLPTYDSIGLSATFLFVFIRLVHGFAIGGLVPSSLVFTLENQSYENWGLYGSYVMVSANIGALLGNFFGTTANLTSYPPKKENKQPWHISNGAIFSESYARPQQHQAQVQSMSLRRFSK